MTAAVQLQDVTKRFGQVIAADDINLTVSPGELVALVGPSGSGKTTVLQLVAGLAAPDAGEIRVGGRLVAGPRAWLPPERRNVGIVLQEAALFPHLNVARNVAFGLTGGDRTARVAELLELVGLSGLQRRYPHELSGGQRQRIALARALAPRPGVVLFDEPFANLDHNLRAAVRRETVEVLRQEGATAVLVTHDQAEALAIADRIAVLLDGRIVQCGTPDAVFHQPVDRYVATFLGEADFLPAHRSGDVAATEIGSVPVANGADGAVSVMVRPHEVHASAAPDGAARVIDREFRGGFVLYALALGSGTVVRTLQPHTVRWSTGTTVDVRIASEGLAAVFY